MQKKGADDIGLTTDTGAPSGFERGGDMDDISDGDLEERRGGRRTRSLWPTNYHFGTRAPRGGYGRPSPPPRPPPHACFAARGGGAREDLYSGI